MQNKIVMLNIDEKEVLKTKSVGKSKSVTSQNNSAIINLAKSLKSSEAGSQKMTHRSSKAHVKSTLKKVENYAEFEFRTNQKSEKSEIIKEQIENVEPIVIKENTVGETVFASLKEDDLRQSNLLAEAGDRFVLDDDAMRIMNIARVGALFDCDKQCLYK